MSFKGKVSDSLKGNPLEFATIYLLENSREDQVKKTVLSNRDGFFEFSGLFSDSVSIRITYAGYQPKVFNLRISMLNGDVSNFSLTSKERDLGEVKIVAQSLISQSVDRISYNVERDPQRNTANLFEIIQKVPLLSVDGAGNVKYQGGTSFRVLLNGRPTAALARNVSDALKGIPASSIKNIEVITNPSGKYYQEGATGVINIITSKTKEDGYEGAIYAEYKAPAQGPGVSASLNLKINKISLNSSFGYVNNEKPPTTKLFNSLVPNSNFLNSTQQGIAESNNNSLFFSEDFSYEIDSLNLLTARVALYDQKNNDFSNLITQINPSDAMALIQYELQTGKFASWKGFEAALDYQRNFAKKKGRVLTFSYLFTNSLDDQKNDVLFANKINFSQNNFFQYNTFQQLEHTLQIDYSHKIKKITFDVGLKGIIRLGDSEGSTIQNLFQDNINLMTINRYKNDQYIPAGYISAKYQSGKFGVIVGGRAEQTITRAKFEGLFDEFQGTYFNFLPNFALNYSMDKINSLNLLYNRTIQRPNISYLNPFVNRLNPTLEVIGNPELVPVGIHNLSLQYRRFKKSSLIIALSHNFSSNTIQRIISSTSEASVTRFSFANVGKATSSALNLSYNLPISKSLNFNASQNTLYAKFNAFLIDEVIERTGFQFDYNLGLTAAVNKTTNIAGRFSYSTPTIQLQGRTTTYPYFVFTGTKTFYKNKIGLTATIINPFSKYRFVSTTFNGNDISTFSGTEIFYRSFSIRASYRFGEISKRNRRNEKGIRNNDSISIK